MAFFLDCSKSLRFSFFLSAFIACFLIKESQSQLLPVEEVQALQTISEKLSNIYWKVDRNSCNVAGDLNRNFSDKIFSKVNCDCSFNSNSICHVTGILLKGLNLTGALPAEFGNLSYLRVLDLTRNVINGSIPTSFSEIPLTNVSLLGNQISGLIPEELGNIGTLEELVLEDNMLDGSIPQSLGKLSRLKRLLLSANNLTGTIPDSFGNLKNLTDFRIDGNQLSGKIPEWLGNWTNMGRLDMQGTLMEGPIPSSLSNLTKLRELRISDVPGPSIKFPDLQNMKEMHTLILRNCLINDSIPEYISEMTKLKILDLSFNKLFGQIPESFQKLEQLNYMFLNNNSLTGSVPNWIYSRKESFDLSYNNFTGSTPATCQQDFVNLVSSYSSQDNTSTPWCWKKGLPCSGNLDRSSLFINCGGTRSTFEGLEYDEDLMSEVEASDFFYSEGKWAYSSTGTFMGQDKADYVASTMMLANDTSPDIYRTARLAPTSLIYYGLCLKEGNYRVRLHFAEIMYSDDHTFTSNGRRVFDVFIQGKLVMKEFNIKEEAKGVRKGIYRDFDAEVNGGALEIQLYWSGKGTTAIPDRGVYGPLISAIAVTPSSAVSTGLFSNGVLGIVMASLVLPMFL